MKAVADFISVRGQKRGVPPNCACKLFGWRRQCFFFVHLDFFHFDFFNSLFQFHFDFNFISISNNHFDFNFISNSFRFQLHLKFISISASSQIHFDFNFISNSFQHVRCTMPRAPKKSQGLVSDAPRLAWVRHKKIPWGKRQDGSWARATTARWCAPPLRAAAV